MSNSTVDNGDTYNWRAFLEGDKEAYAGIYKQYFSLLYQYGIRLCGDKEVVKDCIQDLFVKMWLNRKTLHTAPQIKPYLFSALRGTILNRTEQTHRMTRRDVRAMNMQTFDLHYTNREDSFIHDDEEAIRKQQISAALNKLTSHQKECIFLRFYAGLEYPEIAAIMQISVKASYKVIGRAVAVMREYMKETVLHSFMLLQACKMDYAKE